MELLARFVFESLTLTAIAYLFIRLLYKLTLPRSITALTERLRNDNQQHENTLAVILKSKEAKQVKLVSDRVDALQWQIAEVSKILFKLAKHRTTPLAQEQGMNLYGELSRLESKALHYHAVTQQWRDESLFEDMRQSLRWVCLQAHGLARDAHTIFCEK